MLSIEYASKTTDEGRPALAQLPGLLASDHFAGLGPEQHFLHHLGAQGGGASSFQTE